MSATIHSCIIIGTGFSGIAMGVMLKEKDINDFIMLEKAKDLGGTWRENTYPGAECDVPSALYSYSFEPYPEWEYKWSMQPQILEYIKHVASKYQLYDHMHFSTELTGARWDDNTKIWTVYTSQGKEYKTKSVISAIGQLHHPSIPNIEGKEDFQGPSFHSARWDHDIDISGKVVGVIGNAASAVQFIPEIAKTAGHVTIFQRSPNWMLPKLDRAYRDWEKNLVRRFPFLLKLYRFRLWLLGGALFFLMKKGNQSFRKMMQKRSVKYIKEHIKDPKTVKALIPDYPMGAKRILFSDTYYSALAKENVELVTGGIDKILPNGIVTGGGYIHDIDILVYATGFKTNPFLMGLDIRGRNGIRIQDAWRISPKSFLGITVSQFPNFFMMYGPNTNLGHNSIIIMSEAQARYIAQCISKLESENFKSLEIREDVMNDYYKDCQEKLGDMIWSTASDSWYISDNGDIANNYYGRTMEYLRQTNRVDFDQYILY